MTKLNKVFAIKKIIILVVLIAILILLTAYLLASFSYTHPSVPAKVNSYIINNKYYGFALKAPENWVAEAKASYTQDNIAQLFSECKSDKSSQASVYEIGRFRFEDQKYPQGFGDSGYLPAGSKSGAILDITVNCIPVALQNKLVDYNYSNLKIGGEKAFQEFLNLLGFGQTKYLSFFHNNLQYKVNEYIYISPTDKSKGYEKGKSKEADLRAKYAAAFDGIISSFKFTN